MDENSSRSMVFHALNCFCRFWITGTGMIHRSWCYQHYKPYLSSLHSHYASSSYGTACRWGWVPRWTSRSAANPLQFLRRTRAGSLTLLRSCSHSLFLSPNLTKVTHTLCIPVSRELKNMITYSFSAIWRQLDRPIYLNFNWLSCSCKYTRNLDSAIVSISLIHDVIFIRHKI